MNCRKLCTTLFTSSLLLTSTNILANQWELNAGFAFSAASVKAPPNEYGDVYTLGSEDDINLHLNGSYYFKKLATDVGPLDQAAFLSKSSRASVSFSEQGSYEGLAYRFDPSTYGKTYGMGFKGVIEDYIVVASYNHGELNGAVTTEEVRQNKLALGLGSYLNDTTSITVSYLSNIDNRDYIPAIGSGISYREDRGIDVAGRSFHAYENGQSLGYGANLAVLHTRVAGINASGISYELGGHVSYHPTKYWTIKVEAIHTDFNDNNYVYKRSMINLMTRYYFIEEFALDFTLGHVNGEDEFGTVEGAQLGLGIKSRF